MTRLCPRASYLQKTKLVPLERCGPACGYWCKGARCNQFAIGKSIRNIPEVLPEGGFPDFCHLVNVDATGELFGDQS